MQAIGVKSKGREGAMFGEKRRCALFANMSGILDLSSDEKAKHFLPRWLKEAPT